MGIVLNAHFISFDSSRLTTYKNKCSEEYYEVSCSISLRKQTKDAWTEVFLSFQGRISLASGEDCAHRNLGRLAGPVHYEVTSTQNNQIKSLQIKSCLTFSLLMLTLR